MTTAINNSIREIILFGAESYLDDDEGALEFVASDRVCESRPPLARRRKLRRSVTKVTVLLAPSRFSTSQSYTSSSLTRSTRQWHGNSDDSRTTRDGDTKRPFPVAGEMPCEFLFSPHNSLPVPSFPPHRRISWDVVFLTGLLDGVICRHREQWRRKSITRKSRFTRYAKRNWLALRIGISRFREIYQVFIPVDLSDNLLHYSGTN